MGLALDQAEQGVHVRFKRISPPRPPFARSLARGEGEKGERRA